MPRRMTQTKAEAHQTMKNVSFESQVVTWLMQDGWQVFLPLLDHGHKTDILISDGPNYYRRLRDLVCKKLNLGLHNKRL
jgi:hypothetical protein